MPTVSCTNVVSIFLNETSNERLGGALRPEFNDKWAVPYRYMSLETMAELSHHTPVKLPAIPVA